MFRKKIISGLIIFLLCFGVGMSVFNAEELSITENEAKNLAISCIWDVKKNSDEIFEEELFYSHTFVLYDEELNVSAYVINFKTEDNEPKGYVMVGATEEYPEIIEFSDTGISPYEEQYVELADTFEEDVVPYYEGNMEALLIEKKSKKVLSENGEKIKNEESTTIKNYKGKSISKRKEKADAIAQIMEATGGSGVSKANLNFPITNPESYEQEAVGGGFVNVSSFDLVYKKMSQFPDKEQHCGPTTATNLMLYWANRNSSKYNGFMCGDSTWNTTFNDLYNKMFSESINNTLVWDFTNGTQTFTRENSDDGFNVQYYTKGSSTWSKIESEIRANYPIVVLLQGHTYYEDHYVLGLGCAIFTYSDSSTSNYIRIADAWSTSANRYVNYESGELYLITARPR